MPWQVKGSPEAIAYMAALRARPRPAGPLKRSDRGARLTTRIVTWITEQLATSNGALSDIAQMRLEVARELALRHQWAPALALAERALAPGRAGGSEQDLETFARAWATRAASPPLEAGAKGESATTVSEATEAPGEEAGGDGREA